VLLRVVNLRSDGLTFAEIGRLLGVSNSEPTRSFERAKRHEKLALKAGREKSGDRPELRA